MLLINSAGLAVNVPLAYAWINGHWGFPALGIAGAGWATVAGSSTSALLSLGLMLLPRYQQAFHTASGWRFDRDLFRRLLFFGLPNGLYVGLDTLAYAIFVLLIGRLGSVELAASSMAFTINLVSFLPSVGISQAVGVLVGQRLGENRPDLALQSTWTGLRVTLLYQAAMAAVYLLLPETLALLFRGPDESHWEEVAALVPFLLRFVAFYSFFDGANLVFSATLRGAGDTRFVTAVAVLLAWPVMVLPTWAAWQFGWGLTWAWTFATLYMVLLAAALILRFRQGKWQRMRVIEKCP